MAQASRYYRRDDVSTKALLLLWQDSLSVVQCFTFSLNQSQSLWNMMALSGKCIGDLSLLLPFADESVHFSAKVIALENEPDRWLCLLQTGKTIKTFFASREHSPAPAEESRSETVI